ncbi:hypothetical protein PsYK624_111040 [Phanerochaete sordida]|uniref:Uncharacterized protein n=1 Tax=Phanerochaete sordida TaxID=48140 RepID=A0A9P3GHB8_9APHY|nr:hypothetical protein PsYK624_111040 [Phanerochaete sordida]
MESESYPSADQTINKTAARRLYRLTPEDLDGLSTKIVEKVATIKGRKEIVLMTLYNEREVERRAWTRHGSPDAFEAYLTKLKTRYHANAKTKDKPFPLPFPYNHLACPHDPRIAALPRPPPLVDPDDAWCLTPALVRLRPRFAPWLWRACNTRLDAVGASAYTFERHGLSYAQREAALKRAVEDLVPVYPARPDGGLPSSPSVEMLREVLRGAPRSAGDEDLEVHEQFDGDVTYYWGDAYTARLFEALVGVIEEHGLGAEGWETVRWEVYDKYCDCFSGITYDEREVQWHDHAFAWLCGRLDHASDVLSTRRCEYSEAGRRYNDMLPQLSIGHGVLL